MNENKSKYLIEDIEKLYDIITNRLSMWLVLYLIKYFYNCDRNYEI